MSQVILSPAATGDDGFSWSTFDTLATMLGVSSGYKSTVFFRFPSASIPQGATISSAELKVYAKYNESTALDLKIYGNDADNAVAPKSVAETNALTRTTAYKDWTPSAWTQNEAYTVDITDPIQEVIDRAGWSSGNALQVIIESVTASGTATRWCHPYDSGGYNPVLTINYTAAVTADVPQAGLELSTYSPSFAPYSITVPIAEIEFAAIMPSYVTDQLYTPSNVPGILFTPLEPSQGIVISVSNAPGFQFITFVPETARGLEIPVATIELAAEVPSYSWVLNARMRPAAQTIYTFTLTGDAESPPLADLVLPMSSFQGRLRNGSPSYVSCVIPNCMTYAEDIAARQNGDIVIRKGYRWADGSVSMEEIARVDFESLRIDQGSRSASATISGHRTTSAAAPKDVTVEGVSFYCLQADGKRRIRALLDLFLRIGDTCIYGTGPTDYMAVGYISYTVSTELTIMEVTEA